MAKNMFKKHLDIFIKNKKTRTVMQRENDLYYITDGHTLLRVPTWIYDTQIRTISPIFRGLENGQSATRQAGELLAELDGMPSRCMVDVFENTRADKPAAVLPFMYDDAKNKRALRLVSVAGRVHSYNELYISAMAEYTRLDALGGTADRFPAIKWADDDTGLGCLALPVNSDYFRAALADLVEVVK